MIISRAGPELFCMQIVRKLNEKRWCILFAHDVDDGAHVPFAVLGQITGLPPPLPSRIPPPPLLLVDKYLGALVSALLHQRKVKLKRRKKNLGNIPYK